MNAHSSTSSGLRVVALLLATGSVVACTAILKPRDEVQRCGTADDCDPTGDNRYVPLCQFDKENSGLDSTKYDKICVADYKPITCDLMSFANNPDSAPSVAINKCGDLSCSEDQRGMVGCQPMDGGACLNGATVADFNGSSFCSDDDDQIPGFALGSNELDNQHVKDAFCKQFFCDDDFVCNDNAKCQPCDPDLPYGQGGCGIVVSAGGPAAVYVLGDQLKDECAGEDAEFEDPLFGEACR